jgi:ABC-type multidrug transport system ATPase subunit
LLQPPPETVANFDEIVLLGEGKIIYCGPVDEVIDYFNSLGYEIPERMDVADWLQVSKEVTLVTIFVVAIDSPLYSSCRHFLRRTVTIF